MTDYLGAHVSIAGGIYLAPERGVSEGCGVIQVFTQNTSQWRGKLISEPDAALFRQKWEESGLHEVVSHDIYLVNLGAPPGEIRDKSIVAFGEEMVRCARLGIGKIVMHPGAHTGEGEEVGLRRISEALDQLFAAVPAYTGKILLETTAGQGSNLGYRFEQLKAIIDHSAFPDSLAVCLDTCHIFAAGYDISTRDGYEWTLDEFDRIVGLHRLQAFHLNDSKKVLNSRVDRHEHIGQGALGLEPFRCLMNDPRFTAIPKFLETPKGEQKEMDAVNLKVLRDLVALA